MARVDYQALRFKWADEIKQMSAKGDHDGVAELVDFIKNHVDQIGVFERQWNSILVGAIGRGIPLEITKDYALKLYREQGGLCAISRMPIDFRPNTFRRGRAVYGNASLDRINSSDSYRPGNVWWVHRDVNRMKMAMDLGHFQTLCRAVAANAEIATDTAAALTQANPTDEPPRLPEILTPVEAMAWFLRSCSEDDPHAFEYAHKIMERYQAWRVGANVPPLTQTAMGRALGALGFRRAAGHWVKWWGIRLLPVEGERVEKTFDPKIVSIFQAKSKRC